MRTETTTTNIYTFEELSPEAKQKVFGEFYNSSSFALWNEYILKKCNRVKLDVLGTHFPKEVIEARRAIERMRIADPPYSEDARGEVIWGAVVALKEAAISTLKTNEYEFTEDGRLYNAN